MTTATYEPVKNMVQSMRKIRDEISDEIKDMTFAEERAFLDKLLNLNSPQKNTHQNEVNINPNKV